MKKILIASYHLDFGGVEKALINLLKEVDSHKYEVTVLLQEKRGVFLADIPPYIKVEEYKISTCKWGLFRKVSNRLHLLIYILTHYKKYDHSICYATYDIPSSIIVRYVGKLRTLWVHSNYTQVYKGNELEIRTFFDMRKIDTFDQLVFISDEAKRDLMVYYKALEKKSMVVNNLLDFKEIIEKSNEEVSYIKDASNLVFVGRLEEDSKALLRLLVVMKSFMEEQKNIHLWIIGAGPDEKLLKEYAGKNNLENVHFMGSKKNPYPYMKAADVFVLPSNYEGFPVVCIEALALGKKVVTTIDVSTGTFHLKDYVFLCDKDKVSIQKTIEEALLSENKKPFDCESFGTETKKEIEKIIDGGPYEV